MATLPITSLIAALLALLMLPLTLQISLRRAALGKSRGDLLAVVFGDGDDLILRRRIRALGNFIEYTPLCLILVALCELAGTAANQVLVMGVLLVASRYIHAIGMLWGLHPLRGLAMMMTYALLVFSAYCLLQAHWPW